MSSSQIELPGTAGAAPNNLPFQPTPFIGREKELADLRALFRRDDVRLVTLTGPGGTGKTRLAIQAATLLLPDFKGGVVFVPLASITDPSLVAGVTAQALGVREPTQRSLLDAIKGYLRDRHLLLILDNFEQILDAAPLVVELLGVAPALKILVTSRARLRLRAEREYHVPPLMMPDTKRLPSLDRLTEYEAVRLFIDRATALRPDFEVNNDNALAVAEICARLDGLPLAIELAAARIKLLPPEAMLSRLRNRLKLLTGGDRDLPPRQQTLRDTIAWSYDLLSEEERALFRRIAVFSGGFALEAMETICAGENIWADTLDLAASLVDKSLLLQLPGTDDEPRFGMLETIQEYAVAKLEESGERSELSARHASYFLALAEHAEAEINGPDQVLWLNRLEGELDNLRAALRWSLDAGEIDTALRLAGALLPLWKLRGRQSEGRAWLDEALARPAGATLPYRSRAVMAAGALAEVQGDYVRARALLLESLDLFRQAGDKASTATTLRTLGNEARHEGDQPAAYAYLQEGLQIARETGDRRDIAVFLGDLGIAAQSLGDMAAARSYYGESLDIHRELGNKRGIAMMLVNLGELARSEADYDAAQPLYEEGLSIARELGDRWGVGMVLHNLGHVAYHRGRYGHAMDLFSESLRIFRDLGNKRDIAYCLAALAGVLGATGKPDQAAVLFSAAQWLQNTISSNLDHADLIEYERNLAAAQAQLSSEDWQRAWTHGQAITLDQAIDFALKSAAQQAHEASPPAVPADTRPLDARATGMLDPMTTGPLSPNPFELTEREVDVLRLVAVGLTDSEVAERLLISPRTVQRHLSSVYSKLGVSTRTAAARLASVQRLI